MQFEIPEPRTVTIRSVTGRMERHGDEKKPAFSMWVVMAAQNTILDMIDSDILGMFWKQPATADLPGVEAAPPTQLRSRLVKGPHKIEKSYEGYALTIHRATGKGLTIEACKVNGFEFLPQPDGICRMSFKIDAAEDDPKTRGLLDTMIQSDVDITLTAPTVQEQPSASVTDIFAKTGDAQAKGQPAG
jgi:hypothetical protein